MKVLTIIIAVMMVFTLCSCGSEVPAKEDLAPIAPVIEQNSGQDENDHIESDADSDELTKKEPVPTEEEPVEVVTVVEDEIIITPPAPKPDETVNEDKPEQNIPEDTDVPDTESDSNHTEVETPEEPEDEPEPEPIVEVIDTAALEAYGRNYAASTYGYNGNPGTGFSSNAGYFPPTYVIINTMEDGYRYAREVIDAQYYDDIAAGQHITAEIDGVTARRKINIYFQATDDPNMFLLYCFYGGE